MQIITIVYAVVFGLCFGSFANVLIYRLPRGESIIVPPSGCPTCGRRLAGVDLVPVFSWLFLRGRCRHCAAGISVRYPLIELLCSVFFAGVALRFGPSLDVIPLCLLAFALMCISFIDQKTQEIPDGLVIFCGCIGILWVSAPYILSAVGVDAVRLGEAVPASRSTVRELLLMTGAPVWQDALLGSVTAAAPLFIINLLCLAILKKDGFGFGDVKLMAAAGLFLGWRLALVSLLFAVVAGGITGAVLMAAKRIKRGEYLAFGPFLAAGIMAALFFGEKFLRLLFPAR